MSQRNRTGRHAPLRAHRALLALAAALLAGGPAAVGAAEPQSLDVLAVERNELGVRFDLALAGGLPEKQVGELAQGERVTVTWEVELVRDRRMWFNTTVAKLELRASAVYDPLTERYALERRVGKEVVESAEAGQKEEALEWLTRAREATVVVPDKAFEKPRLQWRARAILDRKLVMLLVPTTVTTEWGKGVFADPVEDAE